MPQDLNEIYSSALGHLRKGSQDLELVRRALLWLAVATRPLYIWELNEAVVVEDGDTDIDGDSRFDNPELLIDLANGLLEYNSSKKYNSYKKIVSLGHSSIKAFLTSDWIKSSTVSDFAFDEETAHTAIMNTCLTYFSFLRYRAGSLRPFQISQMSQEECPLLWYAALSWTRHIKAPQRDNWIKIQSFLSTRSLSGLGSYSWWIAAITRGMVDKDTIHNTHPLYYASSFGHTGLVDAILRFDPTVDLEAPGGLEGSTALQVACYRQQLEVTNLLVSAGANPLTQDRATCQEGDVGVSPLWWAVQHGWTETVATMIHKWAPGSEVDEVLHGLRPEGASPDSGEGRAVSSSRGD